MIIIDTIKFAERFVSDVDYSTHDSDYSLAVELNGCNVDISFSYSLIITQKRHGEFPWDVYTRCDFAIDNLEVRGYDEECQKIADKVIFDVNNFEDNVKRSIEE